METQQNGSAASSTALAVRGQQVDFNTETALAFLPRDQRGAFEMANWIAKSRVYNGLDSPEKVFAVMMRSADMRIPLSVGLSELRIIDGKTVTSSRLLTVLAERDPAVQYVRFVSVDDKQAVWKAKWKDDPEPITVTFTIEQAETAGLLNRGENEEKKKKNNWNAWRQDMLVAAAGRQIARRISPGGTIGVYAREELPEDFERDSRDVTPLPASPAAVATRSVAPAKPVDAEMVDPNEERVVKLLEAAATDKEVAAGAAEALRAWPQVRPERVKRAHLDAKARLKAEPQHSAPSPAPAPEQAPPAEPPHDENTGVVREPGQDDA